MSNTLEITGIYTTWLSANHTYETCLIWLSPRKWGHTETSDAGNTFLRHALACDVYLRGAVCHGQIEHFWESHGSAGFHQISPISEESQFVPDSRIQCTTHTWTACIATLNSRMERNQTLMCEVWLPGLMGGKAGREGNRAGKRDGREGGRMLVIYNHLETGFASQRHLARCQTYARLRTRPPDYPERGALWGATPGRGAGSLSIIVDRQGVVAAIIKPNLTTLIRILWCASNRCLMALKFVRNSNVQCSQPCLAVITSNLRILCNW